MKRKNKFRQTEIGMIPEDWNVEELGKLSDFQYGLGESAQKKGDFVYIRITDINPDGFLNRSSLVFMDKEKVKEKYILKKGDVLVARTGASFGKTYRFNEEFQATYGGFLIKLLFNKKRIDNNYYFQFSRSNIYWVQANNLVGGGAQPQFNANVLSKMVVPCPGLSEQQSIARILSSLDSKIELNQRMNNALEAIGQALFKSWFIDFEFPNEKGKPYQSSGGEMVDSELGKIPKGWKVEELPKVAEVIDCLHTMKPERKKEGKLMLQLYNIADNGTINLDDKYFVSDHDYLEWTKNIEVKEGDCLVTNAGKAGAIGQVPFYIIAAIGRNITAIRPLSITPSYLFNYLKSDYGKKEIERNTDTGTIFNSLNVKGIKKIKIVIPEKAVLDIFENIARKLRIKNEINILENQILATSRDSLLPKLMSGQIRIPIEARG